MTQHDSSPHQQPNHWALLAALSAAAFAPFLTTTPAEAHMQGMSKTRQEAEKRALELKCKGAFAMGSLWMPWCRSQRPP